MSVKFRRKSKNMDTLKVNVILFLKECVTAQFQFLLLIFEFHDIIFHCDWPTLLKTIDTKLEYQTFLQAQQKTKKTI